MTRLCTLIACTLLTGAAIAQDGRELFFSCAGCHGADGAGDPAKGAPNLTGLSAVYVARQMRAFATGRRGAHADDFFGSQMTLMAPIYVDASFAPDDRLTPLTNFVAALPWRTAPSRFDGDAARGAAAWTACATCHGARGEGNPAMAAPRLAGVSDWYLVRQFNNYRTGIRGATPGDMDGLVMAATARGASLGDSDLADIAAWLVTQVPVDDTGTPIQ
ncbi:MAG: c-type cytochrome [Pseudomonadales bacterium]